MVYSLPRETISFVSVKPESIDSYSRTYKYFTKPHRFKFFQNKTLGVALIALHKYRNFEEYYESINGKNSAAYYSRKALKRGYLFCEIDRNAYVEDIYDVNLSSPERQGRAMSESYLHKTENYKDEVNYRYFGVLTNTGKLVAYCNIGFFGEFAIVNVLLGHKTYLNDGIMYLMMVEVNKLMFNQYVESGYRFIMYDTYFGASDGLKMFKDKLGYFPYKVKWKKYGF